MSPNVGDKVLVAMARERAVAPESEICWYEGEIVKIVERNASSETPTKEWDAIRPMPKSAANGRKA